MINSKNIKKKSLTSSVKRTWDLIYRPLYKHPIVDIDILSILFEYATGKKIREHFTEWKDKIVDVKFHQT